MIKILRALFFLTLFLHTPVLAGTIRESVLPNGLKVLTLEEHKAPVVTVQIWYRVGSRHEHIGKTGLSHLTEHMMFKGTQQFGKGEYSRIVAKNGGTENAFTGYDYTVYFINIASERIPLALELESDRMSNLLIDPREFSLERDVVKEERRLRTEDDPYSFLVETMYATSYLVHPYRSPIIGWMTDLDHLTRSDLVDHYTTYYLPNNAVIVAVGNFATDRMVSLITQYFGKIPRKADPPPVTIQEPEQKGERRITVKKQAQLPFVFIGYHVPNFASPDTYALRVLSNLLSAGKSSRLYRRLIYDKKTALDVGGEYEGLMADPPLFYLYATAQPGKTASGVEEGITDEIERIKREPVSERELQKAKNQIEAEFELARDSNFFQAYQIGTAEAVGAGAPFFENYVANIRKVTAEDISRVASRYLDADGKTAATLVPLPPRESGTEKAP